MRGDCVKIWQFEYAPIEYIDLSPHGGDEDYVAFIPDSLIDYAWDFLEEGTLFGCCSVSKHVVEGGEVWIGAHA